MPEGHTIRHLATVHSYGFVGTAVRASSPQGRFTEGADHIDGKQMTDVTAHGKHLFLHFDDDIVHIHLGLYGWFNLRKNKGAEPKESVRLRIANEEFLSDLSGPTACEIFTLEQMYNKLDKLGPDPIKEDADWHYAWEKIRKSNKTIGALLMDQSVVAGIGNVYRAELLFLAGVDPFMPGKSVSQSEFEVMWNDAVRLLRLGALDGHIRTVADEHLEDDERELMLHGKGQNGYVYKRTGQACRICRRAIMSDDLSGRTVYWCHNCQK